MDELTRRIYEELLTVARAGAIINYVELGDQINAETRQGIYSRLNVICRMEHAGGRPLLSAVVVNPNWQIPGRGFFTVASELGRYDAYVNKGLFWCEEVRRVHQYWENH